VSWLSGLRARVKGRLYGGGDADRGDNPDAIVSALALHDGDLVADLGSGGGYFTFRLARAVAPSGVVFAVDTDPDLLTEIERRAAREGLPVTTVRASPDASDLPRPVDLVFASHSYHHLPDRPAYFRHLAASLRPGGRVAIVEGRPMGFFRRLFGHVTAPDAIREEMSRAGFAMIASHDIAPRDSFQVFAPDAGQGANQGSNDVDGGATLRR
jgi:arsenite methyltransferase